MSECNHRTGGTIVYGFPQQGDHKCYSVIQHRLPSGGLMAMCTRCQKEWHPMNILEKIPATPGWEDAILFETTNVPSASCQFINTINRTGECHKQIESYVHRFAQADKETKRLARCITKLEKEKFHLSPKFYSRLKSAVKIVAGIDPTQEK